MTTQTKPWVDASTLPVTRTVEVATVGVLTMHPEHGACAVFAIERKGKNERNPKGAPCVIFPTGMVEKNEGTAEAAARESLEELGITIPKDLPEIRMDEQYRTFDDGKTATKYVIHYFTVVLPWEDVLAARARMAERWQRGAETPEEIYETVGMAILPIEGVDFKGTSHVRSARFATKIAKGYEPDDFSDREVVFTGGYSLSKADSDKFRYQKVADGERLLTMPFAHGHHAKIPFFVEHLAKMYG